MNETPNREVRGDVFCRGISSDSVMRLLVGFHIKGLVNTIEEEVGWNKVAICEAVLDHVTAYLGEAITYAEKDKDSKYPYYTLAQIIALYEARSATEQTLVTLRALLDEFDSEEVDEPDSE